MKSNETSTRSIPAGISQWMANISSRSRRQANRFTSPVIFKPAISITGPVGPCSPGIHLG